MHSAQGHCNVNNWIALIVCSQWHCRQRGQYMGIYNFDVDNLWQFDIGMHRRSKPFRWHFSKRVCQTLIIARCKQATNENDRTKWNFIFLWQLHNHLTSKWIVYEIISKTNHLSQHFHFVSLFFVQILNLNLIVPRNPTRNDTQFVYREFQRVSFGAADLWTPQVILSQFSICHSFSDIFLEKHWRSVVSRSVCDYFLDAQRASPNVSILPKAEPGVPRLLIYIHIFGVVGCGAGHSNATLLLDINSTGKCFVGCRMQAGDSTTFCDRILASCGRYIPRLFHRMLRIDNQRELCCRLWIAGRNAGQWIPAGHRK